jgi:stearoyl-CoA desaturase (delta-9 desaturase)
MGTTDVVLFGIVPGVLILLTQIVWIPFWAAGVINGVGHWAGYRRLHTDDASRNIVPWALLIGGEELHNNHHAYPTSARFSTRWYEFDLGWLYIRVLQALGLARIKHVAPLPVLSTPKAQPDAATLDALIAHRYYLLGHFTRVLRRTLKQEVRRLRKADPAQAERLAKLAYWLKREDRTLLERERAARDEALRGSPALERCFSMRAELQALWGRSLDSREQLVQKLAGWCSRAESSGIAALAEFSQRLRSTSLRVNRPRALGNPA